MKTPLALLAGIMSLVTTAAYAQLTVSTVATNLDEPYNIVVDTQGNWYITDSANNCIVKIDADTQAASVFAGIPQDPSGSDDGPPLSAHFNSPQGLLNVTLGGVDGLLVADSGNHLIRFVRLSDGFVTTLAGQTNGGPAIDAAGSSATFRFPTGLTGDANGNVYIADWGNNTVRMMNVNDPVFGITNVLITGPNRLLNRPTAVAFASTNQLWVADTGNQMLKLITLATPASGTISTYMGGYRVPGTTDSSYGPNARFNQPSGLLWVDGQGLYISDTLNNCIRLATNNPSYGLTNYAVTTYAGIPGVGNGGLQDGSAATAQFSSPVGLVQDVEYNGILVADLMNNVIRRVQNGTPAPPVPAPLIGWVDFPPPIISPCSKRISRSFSTTTSSSRSKARTAPKLISPTGPQRRVFPTRIVLSEAPRPTIRVMAPPPFWCRLPWFLLSRTSLLRPLASRPGGRAAKLYKHDSSSRSPTP